MHLPSFLIPTNDWSQFSLSGLSWERPKSAAVIIQFLHHSMKDDCKNDGVLFIIQLFLHSSQRELHWQMEWKTNDE